VGTVSKRTPDSFIEFVVRHVMMLVINPSCARPDMIPFFRGFFSSFAYCESV